MFALPGVIAAHIIAVLLAFLLKRNKINKQSQYDG